MWQGARVSVIFPTYNERDSIGAAIGDVLSMGVVDEVIVVNNNAAPGTSAEVSRTPAREIHEARQGYGFAIQRGIQESTGDFLVISEPDGTFKGRDVLKLLAYSEDFEVVLGSRTSPTMIWQGANMGWFLRWGNWAVAKLMEALFNATNLTDVGCTMRLIRRNALHHIEPYFQVGGNSFGEEMMLLSLAHGLRVVQVPVNYLPRVGESAVTGHRMKAVILGIQMAGLVFQFRLGRWFSRDPRYGHLHGGRRETSQTHPDVTSPTA